MKKCGGGGSLFLLEFLELLDVEFRRKEEVLAVDEVALAEELLDLLDLVLVESQLFAVLAVIALAEFGAVHTRIEALAIFLLAVAFATVAALEEGPSCTLTGLALKTSWLRSTRFSTT